MSSIEAGIPGGQAARAANVPPPGADLKQTDLPSIWSQLEDLRAQYAQGAPKPVALLERVRDALARLNPRDLAPRHPQAEGILVCTMFELARWQATWPSVAGRSVPPASFGYLVMVDAVN